MYLNCKTYFSFLYGTYGTEELVKAAAENGVTTMALTNINNTCDMWDFVDWVWSIPVGREEDEEEIAF